MAQVKTGWRNAFRIRDEFHMELMRLETDAIRNLKKGKSNG